MFGFTVLLERLLLVGLCVALQACSNDTTLLRIGTNNWPGYENLYLARSIGEFEDESVRLVEYPTATAVLNSLRNGLIEGGTLTLDEALQAVAEGDDLKIVLVTDISNGGDVVMARPGIDSLGEIVGKRIAYEETALGAYMLGKTLTASGLGLSDVSPVSVMLDEHEEAYLEGRVDVVVTFEPVRSKLLKQGAQILFSSADESVNIIDVLAIRSDVVRKSPKRVQAIVDAWYQALHWWAEHPKEAIERMSPRLGLSPNELNSAFKGLKIPTREEVIQLFAEGQLKKAAREHIDSMQSYGLAAPSPGVVEQMFDARFVIGGR